MNDKVEENWQVSLKELFDNDLVESGDIIAFRGSTWKELIENGVDEESYHNVGIVYYPNPENRTFFYLTDRIHFNNLSDCNSFILIKSGIKWNKRCEQTVKGFIIKPNMFKSNFLNSILAIWYRNKPNTKFFSSTFVVNFLNMNGYSFNPIGMTPTRLVESLVNNLGRKVIEVYND